jgi:hypothetical protein
LQPGKIVLFLSGNPAPNRVCEAVTVRFPRLLVLGIKAASVCPKSSEEGFK